MISINNELALVFIEAFGEPYENHIAYYSARSKFNRLSPVSDDYIGCNIFYFSII